MKAIEIDGKIKVFSSMPKKWGDNGIFNYHNADPAQHYSDGFRDVVIPDYNEETQKLKEIYFDAENDNFTYRIEGLTPEELELKRTGNEVEDVNAIINSLEPYHKVEFIRTGFIEAIRERLLNEAYVILYEMSVSSDLKPTKDNLLVALNGYETVIK